MFYTSMNFIRRLNGGIFNLLSQRIQIYWQTGVWKLCKISAKYYACRPKNIGTCDVITTIVVAKHLRYVGELCKFC